MIDPKQRYQSLVIENREIKDKLERAQRELADSVRTEIELRAEIIRLAGEVRRLTNLSHKSDS